MYNLLLKTKSKSNVYQLQTAYQSVVLIFQVFNVHNDHILYIINKCSDILNHDIILKLLSNKINPVKYFS